METLKNLKMIAAVDLNWGIGKNNDLLYHIKEDMIRFKKLTNYNAVIMGKKTYESLPVKPLIDRKNIILSSTYSSNNDEVIVCRTFKEIINLIKINSNMTFWVIGGTQVYEQFLPYCDEIALTVIHTVDNDADVFFPKIASSPVSESYTDSYMRIHRGDEMYDIKNDVFYEFQTWKRK